jgi:hypothetical protein
MKVSLNSSHITRTLANIVDMFGDQPLSQQLVFGFCQDSSKRDSYVLRR